MLRRRRAGRHERFRPGPPDSPQGFGEAPVPPASEVPTGEIQRRQQLEAALPKLGKLEQEITLRLNGLGCERQSIGEINQSLFGGAENGEQIIAELMGLAELKVRTQLTPPEPDG